MEPKDVHKDEEEVNDPNYNPEEEVKEGNWKIVDLPQVKIVSGEENEEEIGKFYCKLYRSKDGEWKERATGDLKFLRNKENNRVSALMRSATKRVMCFFYLHGEGMCHLQKMKAVEKAWCWVCVDLSEGVKHTETFAARFKTNEDYEHFEKLFKESIEKNNKLDWTNHGKTKEATETQKPPSLKESLPNKTEEHPAKEPAKEEAKDKKETKDEHKDKPAAKEENKDKKEAPADQKATDKKN